ncbi:MAG: alkylation response protein AidB-like acyl-CoA dehydrogenase [Flavobacteriales bacterium]|jgi:alkylation response protein AidB-like acyl-CoA dehydrogenase
MPDYRAPLTDIDFLLFDVFKLESFWASLNGVEDIDTDTARAIIEEASKLCEQVLAPLDSVGDEQGCTWHEGKVTSPDGFKAAYQHFSDGGWGGLSGSPDFGGMGLPKSLSAVVEEMMQGANMAFGLAPMLTAGACLAINAHANEALKTRYLEAMYSGRWSGAMDLTEPHAGTDLGLIRTKAVPQDDGSYTLTGTKIFITWGDHDLSENIIHLVLAKTPGAPKGSRGISLFLAPKVLINDDGSLGNLNALSCGSLEHKMGIKGSATCLMNFDGAKAWLVGEENQGLTCMFTMMNYERLVVGIQGVGVADASYQTALSYARERRQGRSPSGSQEPDKAADNLLVHPDVRRMLLNIKSLTEASRAFYLYVATWLDRAKYTQDESERQLADTMVALLTPVAKSFLTDRAFDSCVSGQQVLGGHGYIHDWGQEQHVRDVRITQIYEGTNGVQAMDLMVRKTLATGAAPLKQLLLEMRTFCEAERVKALDPGLVEVFMLACECLDTTTLALLEQSKNDPCTAGAGAVDYQDMLGYILHAYMWLKMLEAIESYRGADEFIQSKRACANFYFAKILPEIYSLEQKILAGSECVMSLHDEAF